VPASLAGRTHGQHPSMDAAASVLGLPTATSAADVLKAVTAVVQERDALLRFRDRMASTLQQPVATDEQLLRLAERLVRMTTSRDGGNHRSGDVISLTSSGLAPLVIGESGDGGGDHGNTGGDDSSPAEDGGGGGDRALESSPVSDGQTTLAVDGDGGGGGGRKADGDNNDGDTFAEGGQVFTPSDMCAPVKAKWDCPCGRRGNKAKKTCGKCFQPRGQYTYQLNETCKSACVFQVALCVEQALYD
jgi:hypothetical protein